MSLNGFSSGAVSFFRGFQGWLSLSRCNFNFLDTKKYGTSLHPYCNLDYASCSYYKKAFCSSGPGSGTMKVKDWFKNPSNSVYFIS